MTWPDPQATALDRARAVARTYRDALAHAAPQAAERIDDAARRVGEGWVCGATTSGDLCTVRQAATLLDVTPGRVRQLIVDGTLTSAGKGKGRAGHVLWLADVLDYRAAQRVADRGTG